MALETKHLLEETRALAKDNHQMLRAIRRHQWWSFVTTVVFWLVVLIAPFYLYQQYVQPLVDKFAVPGTTTGGFGLPTSADVQKLLDSFRVQ